jgi:zinc/manganese transport system substrate-binding protein
MRAIRTALVLAMGVGLVAGCSQRTSDDHQHGTTAVVASTNVWGSVVSAVTGEHATVKSIIDNAADDPHSYEVTPADAATIADASLVVYNGGGYDHWVDDVLSTHKEVQSVNAFSLLPSSVPQPANEHVFYDLGVAKAVANQIADKLAQSDADHATLPSEQLRNCRQDATRLHQID